MDIEKKTILKIVQELLNKTLKIIYLLITMQLQIIF